MTRARTTFTNKQFPAQNSNVNYKATALLCWLTCPLLVNAQNIDFDSLEVTTVAVTDSIYVLQFPRGGNLGLSLGEDGTLLIDAHFEATNDKVTAAIAALTDRPVDFIINSHFHFDHTGGNKVFGPAGSTIVSQDQTRKRMESDRYISAADIIQEGYESSALPKITFFDSMRFYYNGQTVDLLYHGPGHTDGDAQVYFHEANVFHTGDLFVRYGLPFIDRGNGGSMDGMIDGLWAVAGLVDNSTKIIPGHGQVATRDDLIEFHDMLVTIRSRIEEGINKGLSWEQILGTRPARDFAETNEETNTWLLETYQEYR